MCGSALPMHTFRAREVSRNVDLLASYNHNLLSLKKLLCNDTGQTSHQVALAIDYDLFKSRSALHSPLSPQQSC